MNDRLPLQKPKSVKKMKIIYCTDTLWHHGGIQKVTIAKANALAEIEGNEVWIAVTEQPVHEPVIKVSDKVHVENLGVNYYEDDWKSRWSLLKGIVFKRRTHRRRLKAFLEAVGPDVVISTGTSEKYFLPLLRTAAGGAYIREIHFPKNFRHFGTKDLLSRLSTYVSDYWDYHVCCARYDKVVILTQEDKERNWSHAANVSVIPNPIIGGTWGRAPLDAHTAIAAGRLVQQKNFASLVRAWESVHRRYSDWRLEIWGDGCMKDDLQEQIDRNDLADTVRLMGYTQDLSSMLSAASVFVLTSMYEGFGMVILEAMQAGLPVVSYACPCGPLDLISDGVDGYLVPQGDETMLSERICELIENEALRKKMGAAAQENAREYAIESIIRQWMDLFHQVSGEREARHRN